MSLPDKPSRINFDKIDSHQIERILSTGDLDSLTPEEREYFNYMELVRGLRARMLLPGGKRIVTKAGIIKLLKSEKYGLSDWMARRVYADALNFFYSEDDVRPRAWANLYAEKLDKMADMAIALGNLREAKSFIAEAAKLRGCFDEDAPEIPQELLNPKTAIIYTADAESMGANRADRKELEAFIDAIPDIPEMSRQRIKEDAGVKQKSILQRLMNDVKEFSEETD